MQVRNVEPSDYKRVLNVLVDWWGGRDLRNMVYAGLFTHFKPTCFIVENDNGELIAFILGYLSQTYPDQAYINWIGVHPDYRRQGLARMLYERFFEVAHANGRHLVTCDTAKVNQLSLCWHQHMGFDVTEETSRYNFSKII